MDVELGSPPHTPIDKDIASASASAARINASAADVVEIDTDTTTSASTSVASSTTPSEPGVADGPEDYETFITELFMAPNNQKYLKLKDQERENPRHEKVHGVEVRKSQMATLVDTDEDVVLENTSKATASVSNADTIDAPAPRRRSTLAAAELASELASAMNITTSSSSSTTPAAAPTTAAPPPAKKYRAPSPPRWRFVKEAKSTLGYSSHSAGTYVQGRSSQDLGAKYVAPQTFKEKLKKFESEPKELGNRELRFKEFTKELSDVGRLSIAEGGDEYEEVIEGGVVISHDAKDEVNQHKHSRQWATYHPRNEKDGREAKEYDKDKYTTLIETENDPQLKYNSVGQLLFSPDDYLDHSFEGDFPRRTLETDDTSNNGPKERELGHYESSEEKDSDSHLSEEPDDPAMDADQIRNARALLDRASSVSPRSAGVPDAATVDSDESSKVMSETDEITESERSRRKLWLLLLLLPLLIIGTIVGVVLGGEDEQDNTPDAAAGTRVFPAAIILLSNDTIHPSFMPSAAPSSGGLFVGSSLFGGETEFPEGTTTLVRPGVGDDAEISLFDRPDNFFDVPEDAPDVDSLVPTYSPTESAKVSLATSLEPTSLPPSSAPSEMPTVAPPLPTSLPPSQSPTAPPSNHPTTDSPTQQPIVFIGGCPQKFAPISNYNIGTQVESNNIVYECIDWACGTFDYDPELASGKWSDAWEVVGSCSGTLVPTSLPTREPSVGPSQSPSTKPSLVPISFPSREPSQSPTTSSPSKSPSHLPTSSPATKPTTSMPTASPTREPSTMPSRAPSQEPTLPPSVVPSRAPTEQPTADPSKIPSKPPTSIPSQLPTLFPSSNPVTSSPTKQPIIFLGACPLPFALATIYASGSQVHWQGMVYKCLAYPCDTSGFLPDASSRPLKEGWELVGACIGSLAPTTISPTQVPTRKPSAAPSRSPLETPSRAPTGKPMTSPSKDPSELPTRAPSNFPSKQPTNSPTKSPLVIPTTNPSKLPSQQPTTSPSKTQTGLPSRSPTNSPSNGPMNSPSKSPSELPTSNPTISPSNRPTVGPSKGPSESPTRSPSKSPSQEPTISPSEIPSSDPTYAPSIEPTQPPSSTPTEPPSSNPTIKPTLSPSLDPTLQPTNKPTFKPTEQPTNQPTKKPIPVPTTAVPTLKPTCKEDGNFNLCVAIDMSGSVCNGNDNGLCLQCDDCNSGGEKATICCPNFANMLKFTRDLITSLGELPTDQDFSFVHFASNVEVASTLDSAKQAVKTLNQLKYTGGKTNLVGAIDSCQTTLANSPLDRTNLMLIITDGAPSVPEDPAAKATAAATDAKTAGTFIIPVLIEEPSYQTAEKRFLENNISSDGQVFVADFDGLSSLQDVLFEQVTCQA